MSLVDTPTPVPDESTTPRPRTWLRRIWGGGQIIESCPEWCTDSHETDGDGNLDDLTHGASFDGPAVGVFDADHGRLDMPLLSGRINVDPYSTDPRRNTPHIHLEPFQDEIAECLTPEEFAGIIAQLRAHCDRLDEVHARLVRARAEYIRDGAL